MGKLFTFGKRQRKRSYHPIKRGFQVATGDKAVEAASLAKKANIAAAEIRKRREGPKQVVNYTKRQTPARFQRDPRDMPRYSGSRGFTEENGLTAKRTWINRFKYNKQMKRVRF